MLSENTSLYWGNYNLFNISWCVVTKFVKTPHLKCDNYSFKQDSGLLDLYKFVLIKFLKYYYSTISNYYLHPTILPLYVSNP